jgi:hypothetical protein
VRFGRTGAQLLSPSALGGTLRYIKSSSEHQLVRIGPRRALARLGSGSPVA